jgi:hypothetical protein
MKTLFVGALAATLVGCSCYVSPQASIEACTAGGNALACFDRTMVGQATEPEPEALEAKPAKPRTRSKRAAKTEKPSSSARARDDSRLAAEAAKPSTIAKKVEPATSGKSPDTSDPVVAQAKITIAAKLENPASAEFVEMKRAMRTNTRGQSVDTICGRVEDKTASGEGTGGRPFLYLVKDDEAFVVDGSPTSAAAAAYRNICQ